MKKTDLYKNLGLKINGQMKQSATPDRFGKQGAAAAQNKAAEDRLRSMFSKLTQNTGKD